MSETTRDQYDPILRKTVLNHFGPEISERLIEFAKYVADLETDYVICMARKASRLLDLLLKLVNVKPKRVIHLGYVLGQDLSHLKGRSVSLIDDTLFTGTTIAEAIKKVKASGAKSVETAVFCYDMENRVESLFDPDRHFATLTNSEMLSFCAAEVAAFQLASLPYLCDFPIINKVRATKREFSDLLNLPGWDISLVSQSEKPPLKAATYTMFTQRSMASSLSPCLGFDIQPLIEIEKIRLYVCYSENGDVEFSLIPIITLKPVSENDVPRLVDQILRPLESLVENPQMGIRKYFTEPKPAIRLVQYLVSLMAWTRVASEVVSGDGNVALAMPTVDESVRLFGEWNKADLRLLHEAVLKFDSSHVHAPIRVPAVNSIPNAAQTTQHLRSIVRKHKRNWDPLWDSVRGTSVYTRVEEIFLSLYKDVEVPAREKAKKLGAEFVNMPPDELSGRLQRGYNWSSITAAILKTPLIKSVGNKRRLSLYLDYLVDWGIAVPIIACAEANGVGSSNVWYRGYRHGEDVLFSQQEVGLAFEMLDGYAAASKRDDIPAIDIEKALVALIRYGTSKNWLITQHGLNGRHEDIVRVGFHLHGPVVTNRYRDSLLAEDSNMWLTRRLGRVGALERVGKTGRYKIGERPSFAKMKHDADTEAHTLGSTLGTIIYAEKENGGRLLSADDLVHLTTCCRLRDLAPAIAAELNIFLVDYRDKIVGGNFLELDCASQSETYKSTRIKTALKLCPNEAKCLCLQ